MTDRTETDGVTSERQRTMRVAYTLNNEQPVRCTYISDEPLFYIDVPVGDMPEEGEEGLYLYEESLLGTMDTAPVSAPRAEISPDLLFADQFAPSIQTVPLDDTLTLLRQSRLGAHLLDFAKDQGVVIALEPQQEPVFYDRTKGRLILRPDVSPMNRVFLLVRELRRVWQHRQGALIHPLLFHPDHAIVINRVQAADLMTVVIRTAWELRLAGQHAFWNDLEQNGHHDLTRSFAREALLDFRSLNNGRAAAAVFESWFLSERCRAFDRVLIQQMLADYQSYISVAGHAETSRVLTQQLISALGAMPYGKNYLSAYAATILADPIFTDIRDRSNANFLWFIKFEQSFRATERDLQQEGTVSPSSLQDPARHAPDTTSAQVSTIIQLPAVVSPKRGKSGKVAVMGNARILDLDQWRRHIRGV